MYCTKLVFIFKLQTIKKRSAIRKENKVCFTLTSAGHRWFSFPTWRSVFSVPPQVKAAVSEEESATPQRKSPCDSFPSVRLDSDGAQTRKTRRATLLSCPTGLWCGQSCVIPGMFGPGRAAQIHAAAELRNRRCRCFQTSSSSRSCCKHAERRRLGVLFHFTHTCI